MRIATSIIGVGTTDFTRTGGTTPLDMGTRAIKRAIQDAGLTGPDDIDGLIVNTQYPRGVDYDVLCERLGITSRFNFQSWSHARMTIPCIQQASLVVASGLADTVAVVRVSKSATRHTPGGQRDANSFREGGGPHGELPHYGLTAPASGAAMAARLYMERYGIETGASGYIGSALREHAAYNPQAAFRKPYTHDEYLQSPMLLDPLRRLDFSVPVDAGFCFLVSRSQDAPAASRPVQIAGMQGIQGGREEFVFGRPGLGVQQQTEGAFTPSPADRSVYDMAGTTAAEIDAYFTYDAFSPLVWFGLERFGFCPEGEAARFCREGNIGPGGSLPTNTNGGMLSEGHTGGLGHIAEMVRQLRGAAGRRQVEGANQVLWGSCYGDALLLTN